jgi:hypothetical protein
MLVSFVLIVGAIKVVLTQPPDPIAQLQAEIQTIRADNKKLTERVDANDAIVNRWLMEEGQKP